MGIQGLLPFLQKCTRPVHVREFTNSTVVVDVYCWLHKGAFGCAEKLCKGEPTNGYILYIMKYVDLLLYHNVKPILVFDGRNLPSKAGTETKRRENREKYRKMAGDYLRDGRIKEARECFQRCIDITPEMAREVIQACQERNIDCVVAPYEADAQLAFLNRSGSAQLVISEDSDLTLFDCDKILFKLDQNGNGILYEKERLNLCLGQKAENFTFEKFRYMCIMSGCDYLSSLPGIGLGKSTKFWGLVTNPDVKAVLPKIPNYLKMPQLTVTKDYIDGFIQANNTFLYQLVFDPKERRLRPLTDYPEDIDFEEMSYAGKYLPADLAFQLSLGNIDLRSLTKVRNFDPDHRKIPDKPRYGKAAPHTSVWSSDFDPSQVMKAATKGAGTLGKEVVMKTAFGNMKPRSQSNQTSSPQPKVNLEVAKSHSQPVQVIKKRKSSDSVDAIASSYSQDENNRPKKKRRISEPEEDEDSDVTLISKYFSRATQSNVNERAKERGRKSSGEWFKELDKEVTTENKFIYRTDGEERTSTTLLKTLSNELSCSTASRQAFKPVLCNPKETEELAKRRNPFAKKSPAKPTTNPLVEPQEKKISPCSKKSPRASPPKSPVLTTSSQSVKRPSLKLAFSPEPLKPSSQESDSGFSSAQSSLEEIVEAKTFPTPPQTQGKSQYFAKRKSTPRVSGLLKPNKQKSLLDMWGKKN